MLKIGLTGALASGKSTTLRMFADAGVPVFSADAAVHALYRGRAAPLVAAAFPDTVKNGVVDRAALAGAVLRDPKALARLEALVHPLVTEEEAHFFDEAGRGGHRITVSDIPLLFETGADERYDVIVVVTAPEATRRDRALERPGMTAALYESLLARQMPDAEKCRRAHFVVDTGQGLEAARREVAGILRAAAPMANLR
jgi:dephospho-CoA kinase